MSNNRWLDPIPDWSDVDLNDLPRLLGVVNQLTRRGCTDLCAMKFLLTNLLDDSHLEALDDHMNLLDGLVQNYNGNALVPELLYEIKRFDVLRSLGVPKDVVEKRLAQTASPNLSSYIKMLHHISNSLTSDDLGALKFMSSTIIGRKTTETINCGHHLFTALIKRDAIRPDNVDFLIKILSSAKLMKLANEVKKYQDAYTGPATAPEPGLDVRAPPDGAIGPPSLLQQYPQRMAGMPPQSVSPPPSYGQTQMCRPGSEQFSSSVSESWSPLEPSITLQYPGTTHDGANESCTARCMPPMFSDQSGAPSCNAKPFPASCSDTSLSSRDTDLGDGDLETDVKKVSAEELQGELDKLHVKLDNLRIKCKREVNQECYSMNSETRGFCVIVNIDKFWENKSREGSEVDCELLTHTFQNMGFIVPEIVRNCTADELTETLIKYRDADHKWYDCFVLCLMSHGLKDVIITSDDKHYSIDNIIGMFHGNNCPSLLGKPKLFFIQACQGRRRMEPAFEDDLEEDAPSHIPQMSDIVKSMATFPGYTAFRSKTQGSWFINALCDVFNEHREEWHLAELLIEVNNRVAEGKAGKDKVFFYKQCPAPLMTLRKLLWFKSSVRRTSVIAEADS